MSFNEFKTIFRPAKASHTPLSAEDSPYKDFGLIRLGFSAQYRGNPSRTEGDENQTKEAFINGGRGHPPSHLKFFLLVFSKLKEDIK